MKVEFVERIESKTALSRNKFCPECGSHAYQIVEQLEPHNPTPWWVRCESCGYESPESPARDIAIVRWKQGNFILNSDGTNSKC